jgi:hypothetical protein
MRTWADTTAALTLSVLPFGQRPRAATHGEPSAT